MSATLTGKHEYVDCKWWLLWQAIMNMLTVNSGYFYRQLNSFVTEPEKSKNEAAVPCKNQQHKAAQVMFFCQCPFGLVSWLWEQFTRLNSINYQRQWNTNYLQFYPHMQSLTVLNRGTAVCFSICKETQQVWDSKYCLLKAKLGLCFHKIQWWQLIAGSIILVGVGGGDGWGGGWSWTQPSWRRPVDAGTRRRPAVVQRETWCWCQV